MSGLVILQCDLCPTTFTTDRNPEVGVPHGRIGELRVEAQKAGWQISEDPFCSSTQHSSDLCPKCRTAHQVNAGDSNG